jgi:glycosyltransferase involved in cell wall biosynthesis
MRVLYLNPGVGLGGAEHSLLLLLAALRERGIDPVVVDFGAGPFRERLTALKVRSHELGVPALLRRGSRYRVPALRVLMLIAAGAPVVVRLARLIREERVDLIHTNGLKAHLLGGLAGRLEGIPVVWHLRDFPPPGVAGRIVKAALRRLPSAVLTNSQAVAGEIARGQTTPRIVSLHNPVDLQRFRPGASGHAIREELGVDGRTPLVGMIAHLTPWKGHELFLRAAQAVARDVPEARFVVVGGSIYQTDGHAGYVEHLLQRAAQLGIAERTTFLGPREDIPEILNALDVVVHCPTSPEPFGRVVAEAMAAARPVVAARCGGIPEIVQDGETGLLTRMGDVADLSSAVVRLLQDSTLRERFGSAARRRAQLLFGVERHAAAVLAEYQSVLGVYPSAA